MIYSLKYAEAFIKKNAVYHGARNWVDFGDSFAGGRYAPSRDRCLGVSVVFRAISR